MQAIVKLIQAFLWAWQYAKENPRKSIAAGVGVGATSAAMLMSGVTGPPAAFHPGNITNLPGSNGQVFESNGDGTYTFGTDDGGVGGGATELSGLDDVADTLTGNSGEFIGWAGTEWDDLTIAFDILSDVTISSAATGEVIRYNGSAWVDTALSVDDLSEVTITSLASGEVLRYNGSALVDSKLASTDLSDFAATISGDTNDVLGWNGSAWDDVTISLGTLTDITNEASATDGLVLTANGDGTHTFEAPSVGGLLTPDGNTAVEQTDVYPLKAYGASESGRIFRCTTSGSTVSVKDGSGGALAHDFEVGHSLMLLRAGANVSITKPAVAVGSLTPGGTPGSTTYRMGFSAGDGNGGWTGVGASDYVETTTGAATITATDYLEARIPVPYGAASIAVYLAQGTGARTLVTVFNVGGYAFLAAEGATPAYGAATADNNGGFLRLTVASGHGLTTGDPVNFHAAANTEYNAQHIITGTTATTLTTSTAYGSATATGNFRRGYVTWRYKGTATPLVDIKGMPDVTNPPWNWRASIVEPRGNLAIDTVGARLFRSTTVRGSRVTAAAEPTWNASADTAILDGDHVRYRSLDFVPVAEPSANLPGALFTTVATVPTASTFTLTDAPTNAISSDVPYLLAHNDAPAWDAAIAAAQASGKGGTITGGGVHQMYFRKHTLDGVMANVNSNAEPQFAAFSLRSGTQDVTHPTVSVRLDPNCVVRAHYFQVGGLMEDITTTVTAIAPYHFFHFGGGNISITGGAYEFNWFSGGLTEHYSSDSFGQRLGWAYDQGIASSLNVGGKPQNTLIADCRIDWPNIGTSNGYAEADNYSYRNLVLRNVKLHYGGGNGDQTWSTLHGDVLVDGCEIWNTRRHGSHGLYFGVSRNRHWVVNTTFKEIQSSNNSIQLNGNAGGSYVKNVIVSGCIGANTGPILIGHSANSNRMHAVSLIANHGFDVALAESRGVSIIGGHYGTITATEDVEDLKIYGLTLNLLRLDASDVQRDVEVRDCKIKQNMRINSVLTDNLLMDNVTIANPNAPGTTLNGYLYEWVATGSNNEYYCRLRATGGDPSISSPSGLGVRIRENITITAGSLGSLADDTWYYGDPGALGYSTLVVKIGDSARYNPNANTYGEVATVTSGNGLIWGGAVQNATFRRLMFSRGFAEHTSFFGLAAGAAPSMTDVLFDDCTFAMESLTYNSSTTCRMVDFGTSVMPACSVEFNKCRWKHTKRGTGATHSNVRMALTRGGSVTFRECEMLGWGSGCEITAPAGGVHLIGNKIQSNEAVYTSSTADTFTHIGSGNTADLGSTTSDPVMVRANGSASLPVGVSADTIYYRNNSTLKLYATASDAASNTSPIDITTANGPVLLTFLNAANLAYLSSYEFFGDTTSPDIYGEVRGNLWRGSPVATYTAIGANQSDYQLLPLVNKHRLSSDASREVDGFNAFGAGNVYREDQIWNVGAQDIVIKDDTDTGSVAQNRVASHTTLDITVSAGEFMTITYDVVSQIWRTIGYTASLDQPEIMSFYRMAQWAIEPKRYHLALAA